MADVIKKSWMRKRARGVNASIRSKNSNWKERWFELSAEEICYYDKFGGVKDGGSKKGTVFMNTVKTVGPGAAADYGGKDNVFVIRYVEDAAKAKEISLVIQSADDQEQDQWIQAIMNIVDPAAAAGGDEPPPPRPSYLMHKPESAVGMPLPPVPVEATASPAAAAAAAAPPVPRLPRSPPPVPTVKYMVIAIHSYTPTSADDLALAKGDLLDVLDDSEPNWWKATTSSGTTGFIPSNYVKKKQGLESQDWFHGKMGRQEAAAILKNANASGTFLVRESESKQGEYSLSVIHEDYVKHYHIKNGPVECFINERHRFPNMEKLIEYHRLNAGGLIARLRNTVDEAQAPPTAGFGHGQWEIPKSDIVVDRKLGEGNFGVVYLGTYTRTNERVAVKSMKGDNRMMEEDFVAEARVMLELSHAHLVQVYGVCLERPMYIIQEFMSGGCLLDYLRDESITLSVDDLHLMCIHVAMGMAHLEEKQYIHRDLAARNCLVGNDSIVKVGDFGLARFVLDDEYTASEGTKYPVKWAAPEVINFNRFSTKSDTWSYGIIMWETWSRGKKPYPGMDNATVMQAVSDGHRLGRPDNASTSMHDVMMRCWHKDPPARPAFSELLRLLNDVGDYADEADLR